MYTREGHGRVQPNWRKSTNKPTGRMIGIEYEIEHPQGYDKILRDLPEPADPEMRPVVERDGSLSDAHGCEIVFPPFTYEALTKKGSYFHNAVAALRESGAEGNDRTGMHMNVNTTGWSADKKRAFLCVLHWMPAAVLGRIGGRGNTRWWPQREFAFHEALEHTQDHVCCAGIRPNRIEVRFPQTTTNFNKIRAIVWFLRHVENFCDIAANVNELRERPAHGNGVWIKNKIIAYLDSRPRLLSTRTVKQVMTEGWNNAEP